MNELQTGATSACCRGHTPAMDAPRNPLVIPFDLAMKKPSEIDALFALPLTEFTSARNALSTRLRKDGLLSDAERVKAQGKPPATAWAVNQLYWHHRKDFDRLLAVSEKARKAQAGRRPDLRPLLDQRRRMISDLANQAADILCESGHAVSVEARRKIVTSLESLAAWGQSNADVQPGRLTSDLEPLGFDALAALLDGVAFEPARVLPFRSAQKAGAAPSRIKDAEEKAAARARAKEALKAAEKKLKTARNDAERAEAAAAKAAAHADVLEKEKREAEALHRKAEKAAREAADEAARTARSLAEAERAVALARKALP